MAELLVKAKPHWMDSLTQKQVEKLPPDEQESYKSRSQIGDIIVVRPDGWKWGREECLPNYVIIKVPDLSFEEAQKYEMPLVEIVIEKTPEGDDIEVEKVINPRKYQIDPVVIENLKTQQQVSLSKSKEDLENTLIIRVKNGEPIKENS